MRSKLLSEPEIARIALVTMTPESAGRMIFERTCISLAPSILAASMMEVSIFCRLAVKMMKYVPVYIQRITKRTLIIGWLDTAGSYAGLKILMRSVQAPLGAKKLFHRIPITTVEITHGR